MENLKSSGPIDQSPMTEDNEMIVVKNLDCYGSTSTMSLVRINGVQYIKKQLLPEYEAQPYFRNLFRKEYEAGRRLDSPYVIRYERLVENEEETYILRMHAGRKD